MTNPMALEAPRWLDFDRYGEAAREWFIRNTSLQTIEADQIDFTIRHQYRYPPLVVAVFIAEQVNEIPLLQQNADEDVGRRHRRGTTDDRQSWLALPRCDDEAEIERVSHELVVERVRKVGAAAPSAGQVMAT